METDKQYDEKVEKQIKTYSSSNRWANIVTNRIYDDRVTRYIIGGILVTNYETLPIQVVQAKRREIIKSTGVSDHSLFQYMQAYRTLRTYSVGATMAKKYGVTISIHLHKYANGDKDKFIEAIDFVDEHGPSKFTRMVVRKAPLDSEDVVFMRFALTPEQKDTIVNVLGTMEARHQGSQLVELVNCYMVLQHSHKVAAE